MSANYTFMTHVSYPTLSMLRLQDVKTGLAEAALGEGTGGKLHKLSVKDIKFVSVFYHSESQYFYTDTPFSYSE